MIMTDNRTVEIHHAIRKLARALQTLPLDELPEVCNIEFHRNYSADEVEVTAQLGVREDVRGLRAWRDALPAAVIVAEPFVDGGGAQLTARGALAGVPFEVWSAIRELPSAVVELLREATTPAAAGDLTLDYLDRHAADETADAETGQA
jgi:hypothetical protein